MNDPLAYDPEDAYYGLLGEFAKRHRDQIPLNLAAFFAMLLPAIGSLIGRRAVIKVSRDCHYPNLFSAIVGSTGSGKGNCWNIVEDLLLKIDPTSASRLHRDVASAPGLIGLVRDASTRVERGKEIQDPGIPDKRCLLVFEEMDTLFVAMSRTGSTLAPVWNMAYDGKTLESNGRLREKATNPHISAVCHITEESFQQAVQHVSKGLGRSNGLYNRFITAHATKERKLSRGGEMPDVSELVEQIRNVLSLPEPAITREAVTITWHPSTYAAWDAFVDALDGDHPFIVGLGGLAARLKPNTMRVAMIFAVMDGSREIRPCHLTAAKSFCLQCIDSSRDLFGSSSKHWRPITLRERVLKVIDHSPKTLTQLHHGLHRKGYDGSALQQVLAELTDQGVVHATSVFTERGKAVPAWFVPEEPLAAEQCESHAMSPRMICGAPIRITQDTQAVRMDGSSESLAEGQTAHLASIPKNTPGHERVPIVAMSKLYPGHLCVLLGGEPAFVDRSALQV
jgi:hypothetical protein